MPVCDCLGVVLVALLLAVVEELCVCFVLLYGDLLVLVEQRWNDGVGLHKV